MFDKCRVELNELSRFGRKSTPAFSGSNKIIEINSFRTKLFFGRKINLRYRSMTVSRLQGKCSRLGLAKIVKVGEPGFLGDEPPDCSAESLGQISAIAKPLASGRAR